MSTKPCCLEDSLSNLFLMSLVYPQRDAQATGLLDTWR